MTDWPKIFDWESRLKTTGKCLAWFNSSKLSGVTFVEQDQFPGKAEFPSQYPVKSEKKQKFNEN